ncbi:MAG: hypothetical protein ACTS3F_14235 [Phycisphaerales bacterium]
MGPPQTSPGTSEPAVRQSRVWLRANLRALRGAEAIDDRGVQGVLDAFSPGAEPEAPVRGPFPGDAALRDALGDCSSPRPPIIVVGINPLGRLERVCALLSSAEWRAVHRRRVIVVETCIESAAGVLATSDPDGAGAIAHHADRLLCFFGPGGVEALERWLADRIDMALPDVVLGSEAAPRAGGGGSEGVEPAIRVMLDRLRTAQRIELDRLVARTSPAPVATDAEALAWCRTALAARGVLQEGAAGSRCLSILLCGSRYTTFVRHALERLAEAFESLGHRPTILMEPDGSSILTKLAYRRCIERARPDLIVTPNYPRALLDGALPSSIPHVCWIQDSLTHLFDPRIPGECGETEMFIGNALAELSGDHGYPSHTMVPWPIPACESRFTPAPVEPALAARYDCDLAFVSHHSEPPEAMRDRLILEMPRHPQARGIVELLWVAAQELVDRSSRERIFPRLDRTIDEALHRVTDEPATARQRNTLKHQILLPLIGRIFRHQALHWCADICGRRGWRMRIFGRGWDRCTGLAGYAGPPIEHGEPLRTAYQSARVHLHADPNTLTHQRVFECALSGGLPIARVAVDALEPLRVAAEDERRERGASATREAAPLWRRYAQACESLGIPLESPGMGHSTPAHRCLGEHYRATVTPRFDADWLYAGIGTLGFVDPAGLESLLERAIEDRGWREERSAAMRDRVRETVGMRRFGADLLENAWKIIGWRSSCIDAGYGWPPDMELYRRRMAEREGAHHAA